MLVPAAISVPSRGDRAHDHRNAPCAQLEHVERAELDADEDDAEAEQLAHREADARLDRGRQRHRVAQQHADEDRDRHTRDRARLAGGIDALEPEQPVPDHVGERERYEHHGDREQRARQQRRQRLRVADAEGAVEQTTAWRGVRHERRQSSIAA